MFLFVTLSVQAQEPISYAQVDSITYKSFLAGSWDEVIKVGKEAIAAGIDYKFLRQRMGYAYFAKENYFAAHKQYKKALEFDAYDANSLTYLYLCSLEIGDDAYSRSFAGKLPAQTKKDFHIKAFRPLDAIDLEYNYKSNTSSLRSDPIYMRLGINSQIGYHWSLYQSGSQYSQLVNNNAQTDQTEYYAMLSGNIAHNTTVDIAYHYLSTKINTETFAGNMFYGGITQRFGRYHLNVNGSSMSNDMGKAKQIGGVAGVVLPGRANIYFNTAYIRMIEPRNNRNIFAETIGARLFKPLWIEANITTGNLKNYNDTKALYVYNSVDPTTFRSGLSMFLNIGKHLTITTNYTYDIKSITDQNINSNYNQHSYSGGLRWKF